MNKMLSLFILAALPAFAQAENFVNIKTLDTQIVLDMKYATSDNFLKQSVYPCGECYLRKNTAIALAKANQEFQKIGYRIKVFDCYRPLSVQKKMWQILPNSTYVANPVKGSRHNRGAAVDLTLVDSHGRELDMGTPFDFFGQKAHHDYKKLPKDVQANRQLLKSTLAKYNFQGIRSEWWHYEYQPDKNAQLSDFVWQCPVSH